MKNALALPSQLEVTTVQDQLNRDTGISLPLSSSIQGVTIITIASLIAAFTFFGNLLMIRLLYDLPSSKLRKSTKLFLCYLCGSYCTVCILIVSKLCQLNCYIILLILVNVSTHIISAIIYPVMEIFVMVKKPHSHYRIVSTRTCIIGIFISGLISVAVDVVAYTNMKEPDNKPFCYITNGSVNPIVTCIGSGIFGAIFIGAVTLQISTIREIKKVFPEIQVVSSNVINIQVVSVPPVGPQVSQNENGTNSSLLKLTKMISVSLCCSVLCWTPSIASIFIFSLFDILDIKIQEERQIVVGTGGLASLNGLIHVIVFFSMSTQLKQAANRYFKSWFCQSSN